MARNPTPKVPPIETAPLPEQQLVVMQKTAAGVTDQAAGWVHAGMHAGRIQAAMLSATVASRIIAQSYAEVAKSGTWEGMPYLDEEGATRCVASIDEYCRAFFGRSQRRCQELAANYDLLGADLYEQAERIGLRQRDYNAIKALPADDQVVIKQAIEGGGDRETVIEQLASLAERQIREKEALAKERDDAREQYTAREGTIAKNVELIQELRENNALLPRMKPDKKGAQMVQELAGLCVGARAEIRHLDMGVKALLNHAGEHGLDYTTELSGRLFEVGIAVAALLGDLRVAGVSEPADRVLDALKPPKEA